MGPDYDDPCERPSKRRRLNDPGLDQVWQSIESEIDIEQDPTVPAIHLWPADEDSVHIWDINSPCNDVASQGCGHAALDEPTLCPLFDLDDPAAQYEFEKEETATDQVCFGMVGGVRCLIVRPLSSFAAA